MSMVCPPSLYNAAIVSYVVNPQIYIPITQHRAHCVAGGGEVVHTAKNKADYDPGQEGAGQRR